MDSTRAVGASGSDMVLRTKCRAFTPSVGIATGGRTSWKDLQEDGEAIGRLERA